MKHIKKFNESLLNGTKDFTEEEVNNLSGDDLERFLIIWSEGDDLYVEKLSDLSEPGKTNIESIDNNIQHISGNLLYFGWIENNKLHEVVWK
jgi:hypothetical protein